MAQITAEQKRTGGEKDLTALKIAHFWVKGYV